MPYVAPLAKKDAPDAARPLLDAIEEKYGRVLNIFGTMAHQPDVLKGIATVNDGLQKDLSPKLRELAYVAASKANGCAYCSHYHTKAARKAGVTDEQIAALDNGDDGTVFDEQEQAVVAYAVQLTRTAEIEAPAVERLKSFLDDRQLVTLAATVALANFTNRFNHGLGIELP
jgi:uncharacterized peroxidase-related enzyme